MRELSLRTKFTLPVALVMVVVMAAVTAVSFFSTRSALTEASQQDLRGSAQGAAQLFDVWLEGARAQGEVTGKRLVFREVCRNNTPETSRVASEELARQVKGDKSFQRVSLADTSGLFVASSDASAVGKTNVATRDYFKTAMQGKSVVSEVIISLTDGKPTFIVATPVRDGEKVVGVVVSSVNLADLSARFLDRIKPSASGYALMFDDKGRLLAHVDKAKIMKEDLNKSEYGKALLAQKKGLATFQQDGREWMAGLESCAGTPWTVAALAPSEEIFAEATRARNLNLILAGAGILAMLVLLFFLVRMLTKPLSWAVETLTSGADQVAAAASQVASAAQNLAAGSSEQAASLEETSASLEEIVSMVRSTSDNASQADNLTAKSSERLAQAAQAMDSMAQAMTQIGEAGQAIGKVVKSIDEIAFQTNLLALNAAVEAARAGEAGAGFAVVAEEVRNLALRAAQAAKNTQELIEGTVTSIQDGSRLVAQAQEGFGQVAQASQEVGGLIGQIASASREQTQGVDQVNLAVSQMDKVVQANAAHAEESASAAEELKAQAASLLDVTGRLQTLVHGGS